MQKLLNHNPEDNNIFLFVRSVGTDPYSFVGLLEYFSHDPKSSQPVHFVWRVRDWDLQAEDLDKLDLVYREPLDPAYSPHENDSLGNLVQVAAPPPSVVPPTATARQFMGRKKVDWALRDERNRLLGLRGEEMVLKHEKRTLTNAGRADLAALVQHISLVDSSAGYDILSFNAAGEPQRIEVKTTQGPLTVSVRPSPS